VHAWETQSQALAIANLTANNAATRGKSSRARLTADVRTLCTTPHVRASLSARPARRCSYGP
jgi:hypothetical protein